MEAVGRPRDARPSPDDRLYCRLHGNANQRNSRTEVERYRLQGDDNQNRPNNGRQARKPDEGGRIASRGIPASRSGPIAPDKLEETREKLGVGFDQSHYRPSVPPEHALRGSPETRLEAGSGFGRGLAYFQTHVSATLADLGEELETQKALMRHRTSP